MRSLQQKVHVQESVMALETQNDRPEIRSIEICGRDQMIAAALQIPAAAECYVQN